VSESIESLMCSSLGIIYNINNLPPMFKKIIKDDETVTDIQNAYLRNYEYLLDIVK